VNKTVASAAQLAKLCFFFCFSLFTYNC